VVIGGQLRRTVPSCGTRSVAKPDRLLHISSCRICSRIVYRSTANIPASTRRARIPFTSWRSPSTRSGQRCATTLRGWPIASSALLTDLAGNTHRASSASDKLYSRLSGSRPRLCELPRIRGCPARANEFIQQLLVGATAATWRIRTRSASRVVGKCARPLYACSLFTRLGGRHGGSARSWIHSDEWLLRFEFRFRNSLGNRSGTRLEVAHALEPWHVWRRPPATDVRNVDSS